MATDLKERIKTAMIFEKEKNFSKAERIYQSILIEDPNNTLALNLLGLLESEKKQFQKAINYIKKSLHIKPCAMSYRNLARVYIENEEYFSAIVCCKDAINLESDNYEGWFYFAYALKKNHQIDESIRAYKKALSINPDSLDVYHNLGNIYSNVKNEPNTAISYYRKYLEYQPENDDAKSNLGALYMKIKNYEEGWKNLEFCINKARAAFDRIHPYSLTKTRPRWQGEDIKDKTIYLYFDGGFGDTIMFCRFLPLLKDKCAKILLAPQPTMISLLKDNNFDVELLDIDNVPKDLYFDVHSTLMSLPYGLKINNEADIPSAEGYLKANTKKTEIYKEKYFDNNQFKIGIKWQGDTLLDLTRKIELKSFYKLFNLPNAKFYSVQKGEGIEQLEDAKDYDIVDLGSTFNDFSDTAAAIENLDLVITNDTSIAHITGALGKPCWILLPFVQNWRWSTDISYCPWYKSVKLFKQNSLGQWDEVFDRVYEELKNIT